jgi:hypothetical protein
MLFGCRCGLSLRVSIYSAKARAEEGPGFHMQKFNSTGRMRRRMSGQYCIAFSAFTHHPSDLGDPVDSALIFKAEPNWRFSCFRRSQAGIKRAKSIAYSAGWNRTNRDIKITRRAYAQNGPPGIPKHRWATSTLVVAVGTLNEEPKVVLQLDVTVWLHR